MDTLEAIFTRRSIRKFKSTSLNQEQTETLLKAAMFAPSAGNGQPWEFVVITSQEGRDKVAQIHPYAQMAKTAPLCILVCGDTQKSKYAEMFWQQDCSAAVQNILLAAHAMGLGSVWTGIYPVQERVSEFTTAFNLPQNVYPLGCIVIGYPDQELPKAERYNPSAIHYEKY